ncbi:MAG: cytochrome c biogenesis protein, partial [Candidatus Poribacteria bacterium]
MLNIVQNLKRNRFFKFLSSVRLAVPLMIILTVVVAVGTVIESRYSAQLASMTVYHAWWFELLLVLLWINILCAAISRIPYKSHHTGFVITHVGLLVLLLGALVTSRYGIDG